MLTRNLIIRRFSI
jgi:hypothetical protein